MDSSLKRIKLCKVCGDKATGFNFNVLTCEPCKSFFRRNFQNYPDTVCLKNGTCPIDFVTRRCCTRCRLDKCFAVGMMRSFPGKKRRKRTRTSAVLLPPPPPTPSQSLASTTFTTIDLDFLAEECASSGQQQLDLELLQETGSNLSLNTTEWEQIEAIEQASAWATFTDEDRLELVGEVTDLLYAVNLTEVYICKTIKFCKALPAFSALYPTDQLSLLRGYFTELMVIRFAFVFDVQAGGYPVIDNEDKQQAFFLKLDLLYAGSQQQSEDLVSYYRGYFSQFHQVLEKDSVLRNLILALRLFKPIENISCPEFIRYQYALHLRLLRRYLEHRTQSVELAEQKWHQIEQVLEQLKPAKDLLEDIFLQTDSSDLALLLKELYHENFI